MRSAVSALNQDCFPRARAAGRCGTCRQPTVCADGRCETTFNRARGYTPATDLADWKLSGGIINPMREHLKVGMFYYTLVQSNRTRAEKLSKAWWLDDTGLIGIFQRFQAFADAKKKEMKPLTPQAGQRALAESYQQWLAVPPEWTAINEIVVARLCAPLDAYTGIGRYVDQHAHGTAPHLSVQYTIKQIFIPGLDRHGAIALHDHKLVPFGRIGEVVDGTYHQRTWGRRRA